MEHKPCPFCGSEHAVIGADEEYGVFVYCDRCLAQGPHIYDLPPLSPDEVEGIAWMAWDKRVEPKTVDFATSETIDGAQADAMLDEFIDAAD